MNVLSAMGSIWVVIRLMMINVYAHFSWGKNVPQGLLAHRIEGKPGDRG
jgi:hypothetical protein